MAEPIIVYVSLTEDEKQSLSAYLGGADWQLVAAGIAEIAIIKAVRELAEEQEVVDG